MYDVQKNQRKRYNSYSESYGMLSVMFSITVLEVQREYFVVLIILIHCLHLSFCKADWLQDHVLNNTAYPKTGKL